MKLELLNTRKRKNTVSRGITPGAMLTHALAHADEYEDVIVIATRKNGRGVVLGDSHMKNSDLLWAVSEAEALLKIRLFDL